MVFLIGNIYFNNKLTQSNTICQGIPELIILGLLIRVDIWTLATSILNPHVLPHHITGLPGIRSRCAGAQYAKIIQNQPVCLNTKSYSRFFFFQISSDQLLSSRSLLLQIGSPRSLAACDAQGILPKDTWLPHIPHKRTCCSKYTLGILVSPMQNGLFFLFWMFTIVFLFFNVQFSFQTEWSCLGPAAARIWHTNHWRSSSFQVERQKHVFFFSFLSDPCFGNSLPFRKAMCFASNFSCHGGLDPRVAQLRYEFMEASATNFYPDPTSLPLGAWWRGATKKFDQLTRLSIWIITICFHLYSFVTVFFWYIWNYMHDFVYFYSTCWYIGSRKIAQWHRKPIVYEISIQQARRQDLIEAARETLWSRGSFSNWVIFSSYQLPSDPGLEWYDTVWYLYWLHWIIRVHKLFSINYRNESLNILF